MRENSEDKPELQQRLPEGRQAIECRRGQKGRGAFDLHNGARERLFHRAREAGFGALSLPGGLSQPTTRAVSSVVSGSRVFPKRMTTMRKGSA